MAGKWLELLKEIAPRVARVGLLFNPATATYAEYYLKPVKAAALSFAVEVIAAPVRVTAVSVQSTTLRFFPATVIARPSRADGADSAMN
jgi:ABC-type uncharacterized transport system substrate-binding protein